MVPVYNKQELAIECIRSVLSQTYKNLEVLVSDDSDSELLRELIENNFSDQRIKYVYNSSRLGRVGNYYHLLHNRVKGEWFINVDGDDLLINDRFISECVEKINDNPKVKIVFSNEFEFFDGTKKYIKRNNALASDKYFRDNDLFYNKQKIGAGIYHLSTLMNTKVAKERKAYTDDCLGSDTLTIYRVLYDNHAYFLNVTGGAWRVHGHNDSFSTNLGDFKSNIDCVINVSKQLFGDSESLYINKRWEKTMIVNRAVRFLSNNMKRGLTVKRFHEISKYLKSRGVKYRHRMYIYVRALILCFLKV